MINLLLLSLFNLRVYKGATRRVFVLIDKATGLAAAEYLRCARPWSAWCSIVGIVEGDADALIATASSGTGDADVVAVVTLDAKLILAVRGVAFRTGQVCVESTLPEEGTRDFALFQEVLHHDFELGGRNEWTGGDSGYGSATVRLLSTVHCRKSYPEYIEPHLDPMKRALNGRPLRALDVGCGSISRLRWGALSGTLTVTGVDPLLDMYAIVRERHGSSALPAIRCADEVCVGAEGLQGELLPGSFDVAYCANALDHTEDPPAVVGAIARALRPGGIFAVEVYTREGTREGWWQLHQFDMYVNDSNEFVCETKDGTVRPLLPADCGLAVRQFVSRTDAYTTIIAERVAA